MDLSRLFRRKPRCYFPSLYSRTCQHVRPFASPFEALVFLERYSFQFLEYSKPRCSLITSSESYPFCSVTCKFVQSSHLYGCNGRKISSSVSPDRSFFTSLGHHFSQSYHINGWKIRILKVGLSEPYSHRVIRLFSASSVDLRCDKLIPDGSRPGVAANHVLQVIELIKSGEIDFGSELNGMDEILSTSSVMEILLVLNSTKISAFSFFDWVKRSQPNFYRNSDVCSLLVDNCGRLGDFEVMRCLLNDFSKNHVQLTGNSFRFLPVTSSSEACRSKAVAEVVELLNEVGGSCLASGIPALINMYGTLGFSETAMHILRNTHRKTSHYNILIKEMCRRGDFDGAKEVLDEMKQMNCGPSVLTYNYIISNLCKNNKIAEACRITREMQERDCTPDALTYEIFICCFFRQGKLELALQLLDKMLSRGIEPRLTTHGAFVRGYIYLEQYEIAHKYVVLLSDKYKGSSNMMCSLLASLLWKMGNAATAQDILSQMMKKGLRPFFKVYRQVLKHLHKSGRKDLAKNLESCFCNLSLQQSKKIDKE